MRAGLLCVVIPCCLMAYDQVRPVQNAVSAERDVASKRQQQFGMLFSNRLGRVAPRESGPTTPPPKRLWIGKGSEQRTVCSIPLREVGRPEDSAPPMPIIRPGRVAPMPQVQLPAPPCGSSRK